MGWEVSIPFVFTPMQESAGTPYFSRVQTFHPFLFTL